MFVKLLLLTCIPWLSDRIKCGFLTSTPYPLCPWLIIHLLLGMHYLPHITKSVHGRSSFYMGFGDTNLNFWWEYLIFFCEGWGWCVSEDWFFGWVGGKIENILKSKRTICAISIICCSCNCMHTIIKMNIVYLELRTSAKHLVRVSTWNNTFGLINFVFLIICNFEFFCDT